ncbi:MAG: AzlD domain-containing protein [Hyphomicrobiaceae bacterium]|nr:AzlD domain-containing protein [Hyphomicrobiaceae bacterium]
MTLDPVNLAAIIAMVVATYATRIGGLWLLRFARLTPRMQASFDALPVAVLTALIAPSLVKGGAADLIAAALTLLAATRLPLLPVVVIGVASAVLLRHVMG